MNRRFSILILIFLLLLIRSAWAAGNEFSGNHDSRQQRIPAETPCEVPSGFEIDDSSAFFQVFDLEDDISVWLQPANIIITKAHTPINKQLVRAEPVLFSKLDLCLLDLPPPAFV